MIMEWTESIFQKLEKNPCRQAVDLVKRRLGITVTEGDSRRPFCMKYSHANYLSSISKCLARSSHAFFVHTSKSEPICVVWCYILECIIIQAEIEEEIIFSNFRDLRCKQQACGVVHMLSEQPLNEKAILCNYRLCRRL